MGERTVAMQMKGGPAQQLYLSRLERVAGEVFAFSEPEASSQSRSAFAGGLLWLMAGAAAAAAMWMAF
jgi:hypothetical protein